MKRSNLVEGSTTIAVCLAALAVLVLALLLSATVTQAAMIVLPFSPHGAVMLDGAPVPDGTLIQAYCGGNVYRSGLTTAGQYTLDDPRRRSCHAGEGRLRRRRAGVLLHRLGAGRSGHHLGQR